MPEFKSNLIEHKRLEKMDWRAIALERIENSNFMDRISKIQIPSKPMISILDDGYPPSGVHT